MTVYVDDSKLSYGRMIMSHMIADSRRELVEMLRKCDLDPIHIQLKNTRREHYDVSQEKRSLAVRHGTKEITTRELVMKLRDRDMDAYLEQEKANE